jgi:hypothetical protein
VSLPQRLPPWQEREEWSPRPSQFRWTPRRAIAAVLLLLIAVALIISWAHTITPAGIVVHHTGRLGNGDPVTMALLREFHKDRGFGAFYYGRIYHVAYHYVIFPDGSVVAGRPEHLRGAHTQHFNNYLGIVLVGDFDKKDNPRGQHGLEQPTAAQMTALVQLCRRLEQRYGIPLDRIYPHRALGQTACPGSRFPWDEFTSRLAVEPQPHSPPLK